MATLLAQSRKACGILKCPSGIQPKTTAAMEARKPTTVACTWWGGWGDNLESPGIRELPGRGH